jgi:glycosyltransferase involved in cell wall biosynthesis
LLARVLRALAAGTRKPEQLVVVNGTPPDSESETTAVVERESSVFDHVVVLEHPNRNLAALRNIGLPHCTSEVIALTDDDAVPGDDWVLAIAQAHGGFGPRAAIGGEVRGLHPECLISRIADVVVFPSPAAGRPVHTLPTVNMSYGRQLVATVGNFDETLFRGEDVDYNWRAIQAGVTIVFDPAIRVRHEHRADLIGLYQQQYMYGRAYVLVRRKWPCMYSVYPRQLKSVRDWAKLAHSALAILYQPLLVASSLKSTADRIAAFPVLVGHHFIWKTGMLRQALGPAQHPAEPPAGVESPLVRSWKRGREEHEEISRSAGHSLA